MAVLKVASMAVEKAVPWVVESVGQKAVRLAVSTVGSLVALMAVLKAEKAGSSVDSKVLW